MSLERTEYWIATCDGCKECFNKSFPTKADMMTAMMEQEWQLTTTHNGLHLIIACPACQKIVYALTQKEPS